MLDLKATLRVKSIKLSLDEIIDCLGGPTNGFTKGQTFGVTKKKRKHTQWALTISENMSQSLQHSILELCNFLESREIHRISKDCDIDIFCMLSSDNGQGSFSLDKAVYQRLQRHGLLVTFDFYCD